MKITTVLFDLDGTLADTAPDLALALAAMRKTGLPDLSYAAVRKATAAGTEALLRLGLDIEPGTPDYETARLAFLGHYERLIGQATILTPGMAEVLQTLRAHALPWGVVTNKTEVLAQRVLKVLSLDAEAACLVGGDTVTRPKPHPDPLLYACERIGVAPAACVYVGDDQNDILAAHAAGMPGFAAVFGYTSLAEARTWGADALLSTPDDLLAALL
ncbi:MAG TPA: HAD-IA family hydrolase [Acidiferrobacter sp.]|nr:HAD-IA family hydrolase [Acidiferrobacter sp.]